MKSRTLAFESYLPLGTGFAYEKRINTMNQFLDHLAEDAMPALIERLCVENLRTLPAKPPEENATGELPESNRR
jgi:hypothetical protein